MKGNEKMWGPSMRIKYDGFEIALKPVEKDMAKILAKPWSWLGTQMHLATLRGSTEEEEGDWWEQVKKSESLITWGIFTTNPEVLIGTTGLHRIEFTGTCTSGIAISDRNWWGKGVATRAHLLRTLFAADFLNIASIQSYVRVPNIASRKALQRVGYIVGGRMLRDGFRQGKFMDTFVLSWLHPDKISLLYPNGLPKQAKFARGVKAARQALEKAREFAVFNP